MSKKSLSKQDVAKLLENPSSEVRAETATKVGGDYTAGSLTENQRVMAEEIFRIMVKDAEVRVRLALAQTLKDSDAVPRDVAMSLALDVESVALPILEFSEVLTDKDLIEIVRSQGPAKQIAVASRQVVSQAVSDALVDTQNEDVVATLVANEGADISVDTLQKVVQELGERQRVQSAMVERPRLPVTVAERLVNKLSERMREELAKRQELPGTLATDLILRARERAVIHLSAESDGHELERLIRQLHENGRLTPSLILRALCMGDLSFFEVAVAELAGVPMINARQLIYDPGRLGLQAIYNKAGLPSAQYRAVRAAFDVAREMEYDGGDADRERYARRMIERILSQYGDLGVEFESHDLDYLLAKMAQLPPDTAQAT